MKRMGFMIIVALLASASYSAESATEIIETTDIRGGVVVHLGRSDGKLTVETNQMMNDWLTFPLPNLERLSTPCT